MEKVSSLSVILTTDPGIEEFVEEELQEKSREKGIEAPEVRLRPTGHSGTVKASFHQDGASIKELLFSLRSVHHVMKECELFQLPEEREEQMPYILERIRTLKVPEFEADPSRSFRVTCERLGKHEFGSMDLEKEVGSIIQERFGMPVDLERFRHHFRIDVHEKQCRCGLQWTRNALSKRSGRPFLPRIALKGNIAFALLKSLEADPLDEGPLLDPFCGSGTILLEAAHLFPEMQLFGSDNYPRNLPGISKNLEAYGVRERVKLHEQDARELSDLHAEGFIRYIATNPPYGRRLGSGMNFHYLYQRFLSQAAQVLMANGRMAIMIMKKGLFEKVLEESSKFEVLKRTPLVMGRLHTWIYVLQKR